MSGNIDANSLLIKLDRELSEPVYVVVCGGLVIEICYGGDGSRDVDALDRLSVDLKRAVEKIAEQTGNDQHGSMISRYNFSRSTKVSQPDGETEPIQKIPFLSA